MRSVPSTWRELGGSPSRVSQGAVKTRRQPAFSRI